MLYCLFLARPFFVLPLSLSMPSNALFSKTAKIAMQRFIAIKCKAQIRPLSLRVFCHLLPVLCFFVPVSAMPFALFTRYAYMRARFIGRTVHLQNLSTRSFAKTLSDLFCKFCTNYKP